MGANGRKRRRRRRRTSWNGTVLLLVLAAVVLAGVFILMDRWESNRYQETRGVASADFYEKNEITVDGKTYALKNDFESVLVMGVDRSAGTEEFTDMWMLLIMDHEEKRLHWMHIGRETVAQLENSVADLRAGRSLVDDSKSRSEARVAVVEAMLGGVDIEHYITLDLDAADDLNRLLGGVPVSVEEDFSAYDPTLVPGTSITLTDEQAVLLLDASVMVGSDAEQALMKRQQSFVTGMLEAMKRKLLSDSDALEQMLDELGGVIETNFFTAQMLNEFARAYEYPVPEVMTLPGKYILDDAGRRVFQPDTESVKGWALEAFYKESDSSLRAPD